MSKLLMKMPCRYTTGRDLADRLDGTICMYKDEPVLVGFHSEDSLILYHPVTNIKLTTIHPADEHFDISSQELGYINLKDGDTNLVMYITRPPHKRWRQGLTYGSLTYQDIKGKNIYPHHVPMEHVIRSQGFYDMLVDNYPSIKEALENYEVCAISKSVALEKTPSGVVQVYFKNQNVGYLLPGTNRVCVPSSDMGWIVSKFLQQFSWEVE